MASYTNNTPVADKTTSYTKYTFIAAEMADIVKQAELALQSSLKEKKAAELALEWVRAKLAEDTKESEARTAFVTRFYRPAEQSYKLAVTQWEKYDAEYKAKYAATLEQQYHDDLLAQADQQRKAVEDKTEFIAGLKRKADMDMIQRTLGTSHQNLNPEKCPKMFHRFTKNSIATMPIVNPTGRTNAIGWFRPTLVLDERVTMPGTDIPACGVCFYGDTDDKTLVFDLVEEEGLYGKPATWTPYFG
jgi:hypothetical protein